MVKKITDLIAEENEYLMEVKSFMLSDAAQLTVKIAGAEAAGFYDLKMENAAIIRKAARDQIDRWGLFNPPGIGPFDKDPDDGLPFHGFGEDSEE